MVSDSWSWTPASASVGTSGSAAERLAEVTASAAQLAGLAPAARSAAARVKAIGVWPATADWIAGAAPPNGTLVASSLRCELEQFGRELRRGADAGIGDRCICRDWS